MTKIIDDRLREAYICIMIYNRIKIKQSISVFLICIFCFSIIRPVFPCFQYFFNFQYVSEVLCINQDDIELECHGKCYLSEELSDTSDEQDKNNDRLPNIEFDKTSKIYPDKVDVSINYFALTHKCIIETRDNIVKNYASKPPIPPPKC